MVRKLKETYPLLAHLNMYDNETRLHLMSEVRLYINARDRHERTKVAKTACANCATWTTAQAGIKCPDCGVQY
jgi:hypothetical protein